MRDSSASDARLRLALKAARQGAWEYDLRTNVGYRSPELLEFLGTHSSQPSLSAYLDDVHPDDRPLILGTFAALRSGQLDESVLEYRFLSSTKGVLWVEQHTMVERDTTGSAVRLYGLSRDVTQRKRQEHALQHVNELLEARVAERTRELEEERAALAAFADFTEAAGSVVDLPALAEQAIATLRVRFPTCTAGYFVPEDGLWKLRGWSEDLNDHPAFLNALRAGLPGDIPRLEELTRTRAPVFVDGWDANREGVAASGMFSSMAGYPFVRDGEVHTVLVVAFQDRAVWSERDRVIVSAVGRSLGLALERADQTAKLAQRTRELERSNAELEQFAYIASHDLQAPLRAITSFADVIEKKYGGCFDEKGLGYLRQISSNGLHMKRLVEDLLTFSRVHTEQRSLQPTDSGAVLATVLQHLAADIEGVAGEVTFGVLPTVLADAGQLSSLLQNVVQNALKYHRPGVPPRVHVSATSEGAFWRFDVSDNGIGIDEAYFERVFEIFQRLHLRDQYEGTGVGLALCQKIVERHGGRMWIDSRVGEGSTFSFTLPRG